MRVDDDAPFSESMLEWLEEGDRMADAPPGSVGRPSGAYVPTETSNRRSKLIIGGVVVLAGAFVLVLRLSGSGDPKAEAHAAVAPSVAVAAPAPLDPAAAPPAVDPSAAAAAPAAVAAADPAAAPLAGNPMAIAAAADPAAAPAAVEAAPAAPAQAAANVVAAPVAAAPVAAAPVAVAQVAAAPQAIAPAAPAVVAAPAPVVAARAAAAVPAEVPVAAPSALAAALAATPPLASAAAPKPVALPAPAPAPVAAPVPVAAARPTVAMAELQRTGASQAPVEVAALAPDTGEYGMAIAQCRAYMTAGKIRHAITSCRQATEARPGAPEALTLLAEAEFTRGHTGLALRLATEATTTDQNFAEAYVIIGGIYQDKGKSAEARAAYEQYLALQPKGKHAADLRAIIGAL